MTTAKDSFYLVLSSADAQQGNGTWHHNGNFSIDLQNNSKMTKGIQGIYLDSVSIPNGQENVNANNNVLRYQLRTKDGPMLGENQLEIGWTMELQVRDIKDPSIGQPTVQIKIPATQNYTLTSVIAEFNTQIASAGLAGVLEMVIEDPNISRLTLRCINPNRQLRFVPNALAPIAPTGLENSWAVACGFSKDQLVTSAYRSSIKAEDLSFIGAFFVPTGQYDEKTILAAVNAGFSDSLLVSFPSLSGETITMGQPNGTHTRFRLTHSTNPTARQLIIYDVGHDSALADFLGFLSTTTEFGYLITDDAGVLDAPKNASMSGTQMFYLASDLSGGNLGVDGVGAFDSFIASIPVNVAYLENQIRTWEKTKPHVMFPEPTSVQSIAFKLFDQYRHEVDPGASPIVISLQVVPWRQC